MLHVIMVFTVSIARPVFVRWLSLIVFFTWSILVRTHYVTLPMIWKNNPEGDSGYNFPEDQWATVALSEPGQEQVIFGCGFYCAGIGCKVSSYTFSIFMIQNANPGNDIVFNKDIVPQVVWSANRAHAVGINATLELTREGDLIVKDAEGYVTWSAGTSGKSVVAINLNDRGNLALLDRNNVTIWQSFDHPTDTLLLGQILRMGQKLTQSVFPSNWTDGGMLSFSLTTEGLLASVESNSSPPLGYYLMNFSVNTSSYIEFDSGDLVLSGDAHRKLSVMELSHVSSTQSFKLDYDGHLRFYKFQDKGMVKMADLFPLDACRYPTVCGHYGLCSNGSCSCMISSDKMTYFVRRDGKRPSGVCSPKTPLICGASKNQTFLEVSNVEYFNFSAHLTDVDVEICKDKCAKNCSCKAVFYRVSPDNNRRSCFLPSDVFSLINATERSGAGVSYMTAYIKVQNDMHNILSMTPSTEAAQQKKELDTFTKMNILHILIASFFAAALTAAIFVMSFVLHKKKEECLKDVSIEEYVDQIPGLPTRFTYAELEEITEKFKKKLGEGGFGSVYQAMLLNKTKVAVKRVDGFEHRKKSFLTEIKTIGSIHHANLVRLLGYCVENSHRLLVYEYMSNGSLDKWIFDKSNKNVLLKWEQRRNIILDVAKGLHYLHEECTQKIIHFDIKPHNILLDGKFRAKVSDFGMSKPIDRDRSRVVTAMKGTPGYLAPEWLCGRITEKVDVYGFGMVIIEVVCGRKVYNNHDEDETEGLILLNLLKSKLAEGCLLDLVDESIDDVDSTSAMSMLRLAAWCLQVDSSKRPPMSTAVKILQGVEDIPEDEIKYTFFSVAEIYTNFRLPSPLMNCRLGVMFRANVAESTEVGASRLSSEVLSGPR